MIQLAIINPKYLKLIIIHYINIPANSIRLNKSCYFLMILNHNASDRGFKRLMRDPKFLIVDSDPIQRQELEALLGDLGRKADHASDTSEASRLLDREKYDCVLIDRDIPIEWRTDLGSGQTSGKTPMVFLTGPAGTSIPSASAIGSADGYLPRTPDSFSSLADHIRKAIEQIAEARSDEISPGKDAAIPYTAPERHDEYLADSRIIFRTSRHANQGPLEDFSFIANRGNDTYAILLGDISGPDGVKSLEMMHLKARIEGYLVESPAPCRLLDELNSELLQRGQTIDYLAAVAIFIDLSGKRLTYSVAGHLPPLHRRWGRNRWRELQSHGIPLGIQSNGKYRQNDLRLSPGDKILLLSDGILKIRGSKGGFRIQDTTMSVLDTLPRDAAPVEIIDGIDEMVESIANGRVAADEITTMLIQV